MTAATLTATRPVEPIPATSLSWLRAVRTGRPVLHLVRGGIVGPEDDPGGFALCGTGAEEWVGRVGVRPAPLCATCLARCPEAPDPEAQRARL